MATDPEPREEIREFIRSIEEGFEWNGQPNGPEVEIEALPFPTWLKRPKPPYEELLGPAVIRGQRLVLGAGTGEGKSSFLWRMVKAMATAGTFLEWTAARACKILVVDVEQSDHDLIRLAAETHTGELENIHLIHVPDGLSLERAEAEVSRIGMILEQGQYDVVVLDPLYKLHTGDPNDEREAKALMKILDRWRSELNFALIMTAHMRKPQGRQKDAAPTMHDIHGASAYLRGAETVMGIRILSDGFSQLLFFKSRAPGLPVRTSWTLRYDRYNGYSIHETKQEKTARMAAEVEKKGKDLLLSRGGAGATWQEIAEITDRKRSVIMGWLKEWGATTIPMPGNSRQMLYVLPEHEFAQAELDVIEDMDDDD